MTDEQRIRPFYCGTQADDWEDANCRRCVKGYDEATQTFRCDIQEAVFVAGWEDGTVSLSIAERMGHERAVMPPRYCWPCAEVAWSAAYWWCAFCEVVVRSRSGEREHRESCPVVEARRIVAALAPSSAPENAPQAQHGAES